MSGVVWCQTGLMGSFDSLALVVDRVCMEDAMALICTVGYAFAWMTDGLC